MFFGRHPSLFSPQFCRPNKFIFRSTNPSPSQYFHFFGFFTISDFRFGEAGWFLLVCIVSSVSIIITTVNNNIYNYSYKYKKKHKLLNQISKWKTKKKKHRLRHFRPNTSIDLLREILRVRVLFFAWNNRPNKKKKKKKKKKHRVPTSLLLLILTMTTTYTVAANDLEGVIIRFAPHPNTSFPFLHHTLNDVYGLDLHETDFHFLFDDVANNQQTELYKDAPKRLLEHMIDHIATESGSKGTRSKTDKVEKLFKTMKLSYKMKHGAIIKSREVKI